MANKERLQELAALLRTDAENPQGVRFNLRTWIAYSTLEPGSSPVIITDCWPDDFYPSINCSTTACAGGLAAMHPPFREQGLSFRVKENHIMTPTYEGVRGYEALSRFFDLEEDLTYYIFDPDAYSPVPIGKGGELRVAARIESCLQVLP
jgi:hypothetical protein